jgi:hypothetical protein
MVEAGRHFSRDRAIPSGDPFRRSLMGRPVWTRLLFVVAGLAFFWLTVLWAVAVP